MTPMSTTTQQGGYNLLPSNISDKSNITMCCLGNRLYKNQKRYQNPLYIAQMPCVHVYPICNSNHQGKIIWTMQKLWTLMSAWQDFTTWFHSFSSIILLVGGVSHHCKQFVWFSIVGLVVTPYPTSDHLVQIPYSFIHPLFLGIFSNLHTLKKWQYFIL